MILLSGYFLLFFLLSLITKPKPPGIPKVTRGGHGWVQEECLEGLRKIPHGTHMVVCTYANIEEWLHDADPGSKPPGRPMRWDARKLECVTEDEWKDQ